MRKGSPLVVNVNCTKFRSQCIAGAHNRNHIASDVICGRIVNIEKHFANRFSDNVCDNDSLACRACLTTQIANFIILQAASPTL